MRIHNIYVDDKGETHWRDVHVEWTKEGPGGKLSDTQKATGVIFRQTPGTYDYDWHPAPRRPHDHADQSHIAAHRRADQIIAGRVDIAGLQPIGAGIGIQQVVVVAQHLAAKAKGRGGEVSRLHFTGG